MDVTTIEEISEPLQALLDKVIRDKKPAKVHFKEQTAILLSEETYEHLLVTLEFLSTPGLLDRFKDLSSDTDPE